MTTFKELEVWLSGGAANTDGEASLGGAISTAKRVGRQSMNHTGVGTATGITPSATDNMRSGQGDSTYSDNAEELLVEDTGAPPAGTNADMYWVGGADSEAHTTADGTVTVSLLDQALGFNTEFSVNFGTVVQNYPNPPHSGTGPEYNFKATPNELWDSIPDSQLQSGITKYRCIYIKNAAAGSMGTGWTFWLNTHGQRDKNMLPFGPEGADVWLYEVGVDPVGVNGTATTIGSETSAPAGVTFYDAGGVGVALPTLAAGDYIAVWIKMTIPAGYSIASDFAPASTVDGWAQFYMENSGGANDTYFYVSFGFDIEAPVVEGDPDPDEATFTDEASGAYDWPEDTFTASDESVGNMSISGSLTDSATITDDADFLRMTAAALTDAITITDAVGAQLTMGVAVVDGITFVVFVDSAGDVYEGWVLNADTNAVSQYEWGAFNSFTKFDGAYYGATADGIYELTGDDDDGEAIEAFIMTGVSDMEIQFDKRVIRGYIGMRTDGTVLFKTVVGNNVTRLYKLKSTNDAMMSRRLPLGRGVDSYYWQFGLENVNGADFELDGIRLYPVVMGRRFR